MGIRVQRGSGNVFREAFSCIRSQLSSCVRPTTEDTLMEPAPSSFAPATSLWRSCNRLELGLAIAWPMILAGCARIPAPAASQVMPATSSTVKAIDHVMVVTNERDRLLALFRDTLGLPVVWPSAPISGPNTFVGLALGDSHLELAPRRRMTHTQLNDFAFQPSDPASVASQLKASGLEPRDPYTVMTESGEKVFTTIGFTSSNDPPAFFIVQYHRFNTEQRRARFAQLFAAPGRGPLGLMRVAEFQLVYEPTAFPIARERWNRLLGAPTGAATAFRLGDGPIIRLRKATGAEVSTIVAEVASLKVAADAARTLGMAAAVSRDSVYLNQSRFGGLRIILVRGR